MNGTQEALTCGCCGGELKIVCAKNDCTDPLEARRKSKGPIPSSPAKPERPKKIRRCTCGQAIQAKGAHRCEDCRALKAPRAGLEAKGVPTEKRCTKCKQSKPVSEFYLKHGRPISNCKTCWNAYIKERLAKKAQFATAPL